MKRLKIVTFVGTRPEIIRLSRLIPLLDQRTEHTLVHTGQNNNSLLSDVFFSGLEIRDPDEYMGISNETPARAMAETLVGSEGILKSVNPDAVVVLGDTNSAMAAIIARRMGIPVYHLEAGNRSFDENVPEEINRKIVDHASSFNLPYSEHARRNLLSEGIDPRYVCLTGSPIPEIVSYYGQEIHSNSVLDRLGLQSGAYFVASAHRQENVDSPTRLESLLDALNRVGERYEKEVIFPIHPRTAKRLADLKTFLSPFVRILEPLGYFDYLQLQKNSLCVLSDSGTISEESLILGFKAVTIRDSMERPEAMESGGISMCGLNPDEILRAVEFRLHEKWDPQLPEEYLSENFSQRVFWFIESTAPRFHSWKSLRRWEIP